MSTDARGRVRLAAVTVRDKISFSVVLRTRGVSSHSSRPQYPSAIDRLARALARVGRHRSAPHLSRSRVATSARSRARDRWPRPPICARSPAPAAAARSSASGAGWSGAAVRTTARRAAAHAVHEHDRGGRVPLQRDPRRGRGHREHAAAARRHRRAGRPRAAQRDRRPAGEGDRPHDTRLRRGGLAEHPRAPADRRLPHRHGPLRGRSRARSRPPTAERSSRRRSMRRRPTRARGGSATSPSTASGPTPPRPATSRRMHGIDERVSIRGLNEGTDMVERILRSVAAR